MNHLYLILLPLYLRTLRSTALWLPVVPQVSPILLQPNHIPNSERVLGGLFLSGDSENSTFYLPLQLYTANTIALL